MLDSRLRNGVEKITAPVGKSLYQAGVKADYLTAFGVAMAFVAGLTISGGFLLLGAFLVIASALPDLLDGSVAKFAGTSSSRGSFLDSVADRVSDSAVLVGISWYLGSKYGFGYSILTMATLAIANLISYERAKAESLGFDAHVGIMERAERVVLIILGLFVPILLIPILWVMLVLTTATAIQRFYSVWSQANGKITHPKKLRFNIAQNSLEKRFKVARQEINWSSWKTPIRSDKSHTWRSEVMDNYRRTRRERGSARRRVARPSKTRP